MMQLNKGPSMKAQAFTQALLTLVCFGILIATISYISLSQATLYAVITKQVKR